MGDSRKLIRQDWIQVTRRVPHLSFLHAKFCRVQVADPAPVWFLRVSSVSPVAQRSLTSVGCAQKGKTAT
jgi:hypothetical protein